MSRFSRFTLAALLATFLAPAVSAQDSVRIEPSQVVEVEKFSTCRRLKNNAADPVFIPMRTAAEWVTGTGAFLAKTPSQMRKGPCVDYTLTAKVWNRLGPPTSPIFPYTVDPGPLGLTTLSTVGTATGGGVASKSGNTISYDVGTAFRTMGYLETKTVTVPWTGVDFEGVPETGTANIQIVGYNEGTWADYLAERPPNDTSSFYLVDATTNPVTTASTMAILRSPSLSFDGDFISHSLLKTGFSTSWVILIDNSVAARSTYALGASAGNPNGDGYTNTMLDAQINTAVDFVNGLYSWYSDGKAGVTLSGEDGTFESIASSGTGGGPYVYVYTLNSGLTYVTQGAISTTTARDTMTTAIKGIKHSSASNVNFSGAFTTLKNSEASSISGGSTEFVNVLVLSPGVSNGTAFDTPLNALDDTTTGSWGFQFFAFRSGATNAVINNIDSSGTASAITASTAIRDRNIKHPVRLNAFYVGVRNDADTAWTWLVDPNTASLTLQPETIKENPLDVYQGTFVRLTARPSFVCRKPYCGPTQLTPITVTGKSFIKTDPAQTTKLYMEWEYSMLPGYKAYYNRFAADLNADNFHWRGLTFYVSGAFTPSPP